MLQSCHPLHAVCHNSAVKYGTSVFNFGASRVLSASAVTQPRRTLIASHPIVCLFGFRAPELTIHFQGVKTVWPSHQHLCASSHGDTAASVRFSFALCLTSASSIKVQRTGTSAVQCLSIGHNRSGGPFLHELDSFHSPPMPAPCWRSLKLPHTS